MEYSFFCCTAHTAHRVNGGRADPWTRRWDGPLDQQTAEMKGRRKVSDPLLGVFLLQDYEGSILHQYIYLVYLL